MLTIITKYLKPTDTKGARIRASFMNCGTSVTIGYPYELSGGVCHHYAMTELLLKAGYTLNAEVKHVEPVLLGYLYLVEEAKQ